jgi:hypothetical protein
MSSLFDFSFSNWFSEARYDLMRYFDTLNSTEWGIISATAVAFGFICLKGDSIRR